MNCKWSITFLPTISRIDFMQRSGKIDDLTISDT